MVRVQDLTKLPLRMIGKLSNPKCLKNIKSLTIQYQNNKKAWMISVIFKGG